jgi:Family of unknown function (DUF6252)
MKSLYKVLGISVLVFTLFSCQKELSVENGGNTPVSNAVLKMKIDGVQWIADNGASGTILAGFISFGGLSKDHKELAVTLSDTTQGTYTLDQNSIDVAGLVDSTTNASDSYTTNAGADTAQSGGTVTVTSIDRSKKTMTGTFKFKMFRQSDSKVVSITEGSFTNLPYTSELPTASAGDTLTVTIDGSAWSAKSIQAQSTSGQLVIAGAETNATKGIGIQVASNITPGTYQFGPITSPTGFYFPNTTTFYVSTSGTLKILENNTSTKRIRGNFDFSAASTSDPNAKAALTAGYFSLKYQ